LLLLIITSQVLRISNWKPDEVKISQTSEEKKDMENKEDKKEDKLTFINYQFSQAAAQGTLQFMSYYHNFVSPPVLEHCTPPPDFFPVFA
jgi:hypothetical protein